MRAMSENGDKIELEGEVIEALRGRMFRIQLDNGHQTLGYLAGRLKRYRIRVMLGDGIRIEVPGEAFSNGERPRGRCAGLEIEFQVLTDQISGIAFVPVVPPRRARMRRRG